MAWKQPTAASAAAPTYMPLLASKICFAVDASGSTAGAVMRKEGEFVTGMTDGYQYPASVVMWGSSVTEPVSVGETTWNHRSWGTSPEVLFSLPVVTSELKSCDMWYLLTDGEVGSPVQFARRTLDVGMANTPVVFVIVNRAGLRPADIDISVGVSVFASASDAAIIFKNQAMGEMYVLSAKGAFESLVDGFTIDLEDWKSLPLYPNEDAFKTALKDVNIIGVQHRVQGGAVDLGRTWQAKHNCLVDIDLLLAEMGPTSISQDEFIDLLEEDTFDALALLCKTRDLLPQLRAWLIARKERASVIEIRDISGASALLQQIRQDPGSADSTSLRQQLRTAHQNNLADYRTRIAENAPSPLLPRVNRCLAVVTALEKSGYGADILDRRSNRAMRAAVVSSADVESQLSTLNLDADVEAFRGTCSICCDDDVIMSFALKSSDRPADNTSDFALNFPLAAGASAPNANVISAQNVCFQCALAMYQFDPDRATMYNEAIAAVIPLTKFDGVNRKYITNCLATVLTGGLATGASGLTQVLMSVLLETMRQKEWAKKQNEQNDSEIAMRRAGMMWMLRNLIQNSSCRETFDETGPWVPFHQALRWTLKNFAEEGILSWTVRYPVPGFLILLELLQLVDGVQIPDNIRVAKLMHEMVTVYMARMSGFGDKLAVQRALLKIVFAEFNAEGVPRNLRDNSLAINPPDVAIHRLRGWLSTPGSTRLIEQIGDFSRYASALQYIVFRLSTEDSHQTPKGYFQRAAEADVHMHTATTKPEDLAASVVEPLLTAMWAGVPNDLDHCFVTADTITPFVSPYSASVLHCGVKGCPVRFDTEGTDPEVIRKARAAHFVQVYAIKGVTPNPNGLPENTGRLAAPTTVHVTFHASISKSWRALDVDSKHAILAEVAGGFDASKPQITAFVRKVLDHICLESGRGDIYSKTLGDKVVWALPSFFAALHTAAEMKGLTDDAELDLVENSLEARIKWELEMLARHK
ncbi:hypothetical protein MIND_01307600 [Mycena indigotica]|uniref:Uncharacterized protein n=1 Tax=Mycena indigotica TaxID=2126181 RepID=A0A8H6VUL5_9AGAR|nr:uncharacterized protein MIND_01307600 [Mycena indigotica]KAF7290673.1 hypothetical protein MIND_01307600 [Mycena indigotica]